MVISIREFAKENTPQDGDDLSQLHDQLSTLGTLEEISQLITPQLFTIYTGMKLIGNWQSDGWHGIISDNAELIPYLPQTLDNPGLIKIKDELLKIISLFPKFIEFDDSKLYCDSVNFFLNTRIKTIDSRLNQYSTQERAKLSKEYHKRTEILEALTGPVFGYNASKEGWDVILNYIRLHKKEDGF